MSMRFFSQLIAASLLAGAILGCAAGSGSGGGQLTIGNITMADNPKMDSPDEVFPRNVKMTIYVSVPVTGAANGDKVTGTWMAQRAMGYKSNEKISESTQDLTDSTKTLTFSLPSPPKGFGHGQYEFDVSVGGVKKKTRFFKII